MIDNDGIDYVIALCDLKMSEKTRVYEDLTRPRNDPYANGEYSGYRHALEDVMSWMKMVKWANGCSDDEIDEFCAACDHTGTSEEDGVAICLKSPAPPPTGVSKKDLQDAGMDGENFWDAVCDLDQCPLGKWRRPTQGVRGDA
ncbi:MAG: hypothetical protein PHR28_04930 [candidate division Zixibacteria bacterium]|jgi:hypothetical protein|nr:hypothetical protein [candidate division Zixibacteria bacterium]